MSTAIIIGGAKGFAKYHATVASNSHGINTVYLSRRKFANARNDVETLSREPSVGENIHWGAIEIDSPERLVEVLETKKTRLVCIAVRDPDRKFAPQIEYVEAVLETSKKNPDLRVFAEKPIDNPHKDYSFDRLALLNQKFGESNRFGYGLPSVPIFGEMKRDTRFGDFLAGAEKVEFYWSSKRDTDDIIADLGAHVAPFFDDFELLQPDVKDYGNKATIEGTLKQVSTPREVEVGIILERENDFRGFRVTPKKGKPYVIAVKVEGVNNTLHYLENAPWIKTYLAGNKNVNGEPIGETVVNPLEMNIRALLEEKPIVGIGETLQ